MKKRLYGFAASVLIATILTNSAFTGFVNASSNNATAAVSAQTTSDYIDNSELMPQYVENADVQLIASDNGELLTPDWVEKLILTEVNVETASTDGKFSGMIKTLDHLQEAGINGIWLCPINDNGTAGENRYSNYGPHTVSPQLTGVEPVDGDYSDGWQVVKNFVDEAHKRNIRVFLDIITWGTHTDATLYQEHPEWYKSESLYGGLAFDWTNAQLQEWFKNQMVSIIESTGADGFRADCGSEFSGKQLFKDVRSTLISNGIKIAMFSECAEERDGTFDFEEHSVTNTNDENNTFWDTSDFYINNNIVDAVKNGTTLGTSDLLTAGEGGKGRFYSSLISCHDDVKYGSDNMVAIGYGAILAPFIPMWYLGEEWENDVTVSADQQLYRNSINWQLIDTNRDYYESIKKLIRIRRTYSDIFEATTENHRNSNICKVTTDGSLQAYARYADGKAVIVVPNNGTSAQRFNVEIPYTDALLDAGNYRIVDLINSGTVSNGASDTLTAFSATVNAGEVGVYLVEKYADINVEYCYISEGTDTWKLQLQADQNVQLGDGSYWWRNLQQIASSADAEHNAFAKLIRENIYINGISVDYALNTATNQVDSTRIWTDGNKLLIEISKTDNLYGISNTSDFSIEFKDGLSFNGYVLLPKKIEYSAVAKKFYDLGDTVNVVSAEYSDGLIILETDSIIESAEDVLTAVGSNILIDGAPVTTGITVANNKLVIEYAIAADFELQIKSGITLNSKELMPVHYSFTYTDATTEYKTGEYILPESDTNGANVTNAELLNVDSGYCSGHAVANWVIRLTLDKNIYSDYKDTYYDRHFQVDSTYGAEIRSNILINGKNLNECIGSGDSHSVVHVKANQNTFEIAIPKNNSFGFNGDSDFEITVSDQLQMPDCKINPQTVKYSAEDGSLTFGEITESVFSVANVSDAAVTVTSVNTDSVESGFCTSHGETYNPAQWKIAVYFDDSFATGFTSYWDRHLQAYTDVSEMICSNIKLNGKTLTDCIAQDSRDVYTAVHVQIAGSNNNVLLIAVPKDNQYGFNGDKDFTVEILSGITLGGKALNPVYIKRSSSTFSSEATENAPNRVKVGSDSSDIYVYFDKQLDTSFSTNSAQNFTSQATTVNSQMSLDICNHIKINGETVKDILVRGNSLYAVQITVGNSGTQGYVRLRLDVASDKNALTAGERFTVEFTEGFALGGYSIPRKVCTTDNLISSDPSSSGGYWIVAGATVNGSIAPRRSQGDWTTYKTVLQANDPFRIQVTPNDGYQLKAGSLTYSYMYKGEKKSVSLLESADGVNYNYQIADVVGQADAEFVGKDAGINFATIGANSRSSGEKGIRFVTRLYLDNINFDTNKVTISGTEYEIADYGTLIGFNGEEELTLDTAAKAKCEPKVYRNANGVFVDFTAELVNIEDSDADTKFAACGYFSYKGADGNTVTVYSDSAVRTANGILK